jgi:hypothetical protein
MHGWSYTESLTKSLGKWSLLPQPKAAPINKASKKRPYTG